MEILIDTNIILDMFQNRQPFSDDAKQIIALCISNDVKGYLSSHSVCDLFYILRKDFNSKDRMKIVKFLSNYFEIIPETKNDFISITDNSGIDDLEDGLQMQCSEKLELNYIVTRNIKDFSLSKVKPILPEDFLKLCNRS